MVPFSSCLIVSSGSIVTWTFGVQLEPTLAPVLAWECMALIARDTLVEASLKLPVF